MVITDQQLLEVIERTPLVSIDVIVRDRRMAGFCLVLETASLLKTRGSFPVDELVKTKI